jgi:hypothetical protein
VEKKGVSASETTNSLLLFRQAGSVFDVSRKRKGTGFRQVEKHFQLSSTASKGGKGAPFDGKSVCF